MNPQVEALIKAQETGPTDDGPPSLEAIRDGYLQTAVERGGAQEPVDEIRDLAVDGVLARAYVPLHGVRVPGRLLWVHGGGWCVGNLDGFDRVCRSLANAGGMEVVSVDYRLAPEYPYPAAVDDVCSVVSSVEGPVVLGGDSAGANLVAAALQRRGEGVAGQVLVYPAMDPTMAGESYGSADDRMLARHEMEACWAAYRGDTPLDHPELAPLNADLAGQPPALVVVAGQDILRSDGEAYADALRAAGVDVTFSSYDDMTHGFLRWGGVVDRSRELICEVAEFAAARLR